MLEGGLVASGVKRLLAVAEQLRDPFELVQESQFAGWVVPSVPPMC
jgi:hypothetical protein